MRNALGYFLDVRRDATEIYLFLDEVTSIENWNQELKFLADQGVTRKGVILATGSSAMKLKERGELLPGRGLEGNEYYIKSLSFRDFVLHSADWIWRYLPESLSEFKDALKRLNPTLQESSIDLSTHLQDVKNEVQKVLPFKKELGYLFGIYLITGGFPGVINHYLTHRYIKGKEKIEPLLSEIFIRDVLGDLSRLQKQETIVRQIFKAILHRYGSRYSFTKLSQEIEKNHMTTIDYLEHLENSFISFILYAYDFNKKEPKWKGDKKIYFYDPMVFHSLHAFLTGEEVWDHITRTMQDEEMLSKMVEGIVISHLSMHQEIPFLRTVRTFLWNYYDKSGREIDAILKRNDEYVGIEVKYRARVGEEKIKAIAPVNKYIILSKEDVGGEGNSLMIPVDIFLSLLPPSKRNV